MDRDAPAGGGLAGIEDETDAFATIRVAVAGTTRLELLAGTGPEPSNTCEPLKHWSIPRDIVDQRAPVAETTRGTPGRSCR